MIVNLRPLILFTGALLLIPTTIFCKKKPKKNQSAITESATTIEPKKQKKEKKKSGYLKDMSYEELDANKNKHVTAKNIDVAVKYLETMLPLADLTQRHDLMLELATIFFDNNDFEKAGKLYNEFIDLYPGSPKIEFASYKAISCCYNQMRDADRDQSKTKETIELAQAFLERKLFTTYAEQVQNMLTKSQERLFESEMSILNFYIHRGMMASAKKRVELIRTAFVPLLPKSEVTVLMSEYDIALHTNNKQLAENKRLELSEKFPDFAQQVAESNLPAYNLANRF